MHLLEVGTVCQNAFEGLQQGHNPKIKRESIEVAADQ